MGEPARQTDVLAVRAASWVRTHLEVLQRHVGEVVAVDPYVGVVGHGRTFDDLVSVHNTGKYSVHFQGRVREQPGGVVILHLSDLVMFDLRDPDVVSPENLRRLVAEMTANAAPSRTPPDLTALRALYEGVDASTVAEHLAEHPELVPVLLDAAPRLRAAYGQGVRLRLEPPFFAGEEMFARVYGHGLTAEEADARGAAFNAWWLAVDPALDEARQWMEFGMGWGA